MGVSCIKYVFLMYSFSVQMTFNILMGKANIYVTGMGSNTMDSI